MSPADFRWKTFATLVCVGMLAAPVGAVRPTGKQVFFDDFDYRDRSQLAAHGWSVRTRQGGPGARAARWRADNVRLVADPARPGNRLLRLAASTDGTVAATSQAEVGTSDRKFLEGTYAARVRFSGPPATGVTGDRVVGSVFTLGPPLTRPLDPAYSELDFEYLPNGGWRTSEPTLFMTSWDTYQEEPVVERLAQALRPGRLVGWHTFVLQVHAGTVRYFVDGVLQAEHGGRSYPDSRMAIAFNLWFQRDGLRAVRGLRSYSQDVDWVFHQEAGLLSPGQVAAKVAALRDG